MSRYYTRVCNFYYGSKSKLLVKKKKTYQYRGHTKGEWGCNYTGIVDLVQQKVTNLQKDKEGNIISYPIYNYIMVKR